MKRSKISITIATVIAVLSIVGIVVWLNHGSSPGVGGKPVIDQVTPSREKPERPGNAKRERNEAFRRELEARGAALTAEHKRRAAEMLNNPVHVVIPLSPTGELSASAIEQLGISRSEAAALRDVIREVVSSASADLAERAKLVSVEKGEHGDTYHYYARARKDRGATVKEQLVQNVKGIITDSRAEAFVKGLIDQRIYGGFGEYDVDVTLFSDEQDRLSVRFKYISPDNGEVSRFGGGALDDDNYALWRNLDFSAATRQ